MPKNKKPAKRRDTLIDPERFRGTESEDMPVGEHIGEFLQRMKNEGKLAELQERSRKEWTILGRLEWAEERFRAIARAAGLEWTGDFRISKERPLPNDPFERDFIDAARSLHAARDSFQRGDLENSACHILNLGIRLGWCDSRLCSHLSRKDKSPSRKRWMRIFDDAHAKWKTSRNRRDSYTFKELARCSKEASAEPDSKGRRWFTEWKKWKEESGNLGPENSR